MATFTKRKTKDGTVWKAEVARLGVRDSRTFDTKAEAAAWATEREADILANQGRDGKPAKRTLRQVIERYTEEVAPTKPGARWEQIRLKAFLRDTPDLADLLVGEITSDDMGKWRDARLAGKVAGRMGIWSACGWASGSSRPCPGMAWRSRSGPLRITARRSM
ncbi:hypothetical protein N5I84_03550 [Ralstonia sp. CHL-2022]|uniref:hypothetical protein n=1 Tax=Ralstonia mojiangensis TaxID=2953895 RepID=UPI0021B287D0|nr:hypothetical protein [Ralstonia mojiangensis]MCT7295231.1 hypothetical protein [Ralstonia mojiangensis]